MKKFYDDKLIVLTGGAGFLGSCVLKHLNDIGITNVVVVDKLETGEKWKNLVGKSFVEVIHNETLFEWLEGKDSEIKAFIHLGECSNVIEKDADFLLQNNYHFSVRLADYALTNEHRFIYASSATTYGDGAAGFSDDHENLENLRPLNIYSYTKHLFDLWVKKQNVLKLVVGLKYFNVFGPNEYHKGLMASPVFQFVPQVQQEGTIRLFKSNGPKYANGEQKRDFIYVKDVVRMTCDFLFNSMGGIFNIGRGEAVTWNEMARFTSEALGNEEISLEYVDIPEEFKDQYQNYTCADMSKYLSYASKAKLDTSTMTVKKAVFEYVKDYLIPGKRW